MTELEKQIAQLEQQLRQIYEEAAKKTILEAVDKVVELANQKTDAIVKQNQELKSKLKEMTKCRDNALQEPFRLAEKIVELNDENEKLEFKLEEAKQYIKNLGSIADVCTYRHTKEICEGCRCNKNKINGEK